MRHTGIDQALQRTGTAFILVGDDQDQIYDSYIDALVNQYGLVKTKPQTAEETGETKLKLWLQKYIERNNGITLSKLQGLMMDKNYTSAEMDRQFKIIHQDYEVEDKVVLCLKTKRSEL